VTDAIDVILPAFDELSKDDIHRVRKAVGECLIDMSRAITILANNETDETAKNQLLEQRRAVLLPIAERLIQDNHKLVRQGMMQFLGPFIASFYPYQYSTLTDLLPSTTESDGSNHVGIVAQFFPHATSMVSRLNSFAECHHIGTDTGPFQFGTADAGGVLLRSPTAATG
jgi:serine/threonine-protein phosphatase 4 regulatory subunit 1